MKKTCILLVLSICSACYAIGQTYQPLEDQRLSTGNDVRFKNISIDSSISQGTAWKVSPQGLVSHTPVVTATTANVLATALDLFPDYKRPGSVTLIQPAGFADIVAGTYTNIATTNTTGTGTGLILSAVVSSGLAVTYTVTTAGTGYNVGDVVTIPKSALGSVNSGVYSVLINQVNAAGSYAANNYPLYVRNYIQKAGTAGDFTPLQKWEAVNRNGTGNNYPLDLGYVYSGTAAYPAIRSNGVVAINFSATGGAVNIPTLAGNTATYGTVYGNSVTAQFLNVTNGAMSISGGGNGTAIMVAQNTYRSTNTYSSNERIQFGAVSSLTITNAGSGYTNGTYNRLAFTGGTGTGLIVTITVSGGMVTSIVAPLGTDCGSGYTSGNVVTAAIPGGTGFAATVILRSGDIFSAFNNIDIYRSSTADLYYGFKNTPTINNLAGYTGTVYGFYHNPTLTSLVGKHIAWQNVTGDVYLGTTSGNVGIGTTTTGSYKLAVEGTIGARRIKVTQELWADYVFDSSYQLAPLQQVEHFIQQNKHLPDVPSAAAVKKDGLDLGDNQAVLLKKIEELTLYIIAQNKKLEAVCQEVKELREKVK